MKKGILIIGALTISLVGYSAIRFDSSNEQKINLNTSEDVTPKKLNNITEDAKVEKVADTTVVDNSGRTPGYNWSFDATDNTKEVSVDSAEIGYPIAPTVLTTKIQEMGESVYSNASELDYHFVVTSQQLKNIRKDYGNKDFLTFDGTYKTVYYTKKDDKTIQSSINFYKSKLLDNSSYVTKKCKGCTMPNTHGVGCNNLKDGKCDLSIKYTN